MKDRKFYSGSSLDQALMKASRDLGVAKDELSYRQIEKKHGFLKMRRSIVIEVDPSAKASSAGARPTAEPVAPEFATTEEIVMPPAAAHEPVDEPPVEEPPVEEPPVEEPPVDEGRVDEPVKTDHGRQPEARAAEPPSADMVELPGPARSLAERYPEAEGEIAEAVRESLAMLLDLAGVEMESSVLQGSERYEVELWGPDQDVLLRDNGRPLLSLQHLLVRLVRGKTGEAVYCRVDCDQFHEIREERLRDLAQRVASDVAAQHRSRLLESMAPDERRIVHMTLANDPGVDTESQGNGYFKRVKIFPV